MSKTITLTDQGGPTAARPTIEEGVDLSYIAADLRHLAVPMSMIHEDPANAREGHDVDGIAAAMATYKQRNPAVVNVSEGYKIEAGHGRYYAAKKLGWKYLAAVLVTDDPMTATGYAIADNRLTDKSRFNDQTLALLLGALDTEKFPTGYSQDEVQELINLAGGGADAEGAAGSDGSLLDLAQVTIGEPRHKVNTGDVWRLGDRHVLVVLRVPQDFKTWKHRMDDADLFIPYPGPFVALSKAADENRMLLVQPDPYIAGHVLDKYEELMGKGSVICVEGITSA